MFTQQNHAAGTLALSDFVLTVRSWPLVNCDQGSLLCPLSLWWSGHSKSHSTTGSLASISIGFSWAKPQIGTFWWELCIPPWLFLVARVGRNSVFCRRLLAVRQLALAASLIEPQWRGTLSATQGTMLVCYLESQSFKLPPNSLIHFLISFLCFEISHRCHDQQFILLDTHFSAPFPMREKKNNPFHSDFTKIKDIVFL